jgi:Rad3-related DNA helicase
VGQDDFDFREFDSDFDPARCPIYWVPTMRVDYKQHNFQMLWLRLDQVAARRRDRKGIVQSVSYARQQEVAAVSHYSQSMILNHAGQPVTEAVARFKEAGPGAILVSPSVGQGFDFPMKECEWQFLCKVPFPPPSKILKARSADDKEYHAYLAMQSLVQMVGRGMRSKADRCENFIADDHIEWFTGRFGHLAPRFFRSFYRKVDRLPAPPPAL